MSSFFEWLKNGIVTFFTQPIGTSKKPTDMKEVIDKREYMMESPDELDTRFNFNPNSILLDEKKVESFELVLENEKNTATELSEIRTVESSEYVRGQIKISYITDIHLMHKLKKCNAWTKEEILTVIEGVIDNIISETKDGILLIGGDIASDFGIFEMFVKALYDRRHDPDPNRRGHVWITFFVLGNHELWDFPDTDISKIVNKYKKLLSEYGMYLIHNEIVTFSYFEVKTIVSADEILKASTIQIRDLFKSEKMIIVGGIGFSGHNTEFNANDGIYRTTISREQEIEESIKFNNFYNKILEAIPDRKVIILTHMPMICWRGKEDYHSGYIYVSGHTHRNFFHDDGEIRIYADNQIGYTNSTPHVKWFNYDTIHDYFSDYEEGIFEITRDDYYNFYYLKSRSLRFNRKFDKLYMLKKKGYYCFILQTNGGNLSMLNGGSIKGLDYGVQYYYDNMDLVISRIKKPLDEYTSFQKSISQEIRRIGGDGRIHGCIVDIDVFRHIYVNPIDHKLTYYSAANMIDKLVYPNMKMLLKDSQNDEMYQKYNEISGDLPIIFNDKGMETITSPQPYYETDIYKASRILSKWQRLDSNILTEWIDPKASVSLIDSKSDAIHSLT